MQDRDDRQLQHLQGQSRPKAPDSILYAEPWEHRSLTHMRPLAFRAPVTGTPDGPAERRGS